MTRGLVLDPRPVPLEPIDLGAGAGSALPADLSDLRGATIGLRRDQHWQSWDWVSDRWADVLSTRGAEVTVWRAASRIGKEAETVKRELDEFIAGVDVAIFGLCNCGGCTMETVRDAQLSHQNGNITLVVSTAEFANLARQLASRSGWSDMPIEILPFPLESKTRDEVNAIADFHLESVLRALAEVD